jgi:hypothetical protein
MCPVGTICLKFPSPIVLTMHENYIGTSSYLVFVLGATEWWLKYVADVLLKFAFRLDK